MYSNVLYLGHSTKGPEQQKKPEKRPGEEIPSREGHGKGETTQAGGQIEAEETDGKRTGRGELTPDGKRQNDRPRRRG
jgi:hypothetical protein